MDETNNSQKKDLLKFIDKEVKNINNGDTDFKKNYKFFYKCLYKSYIDIYSKIINIDNISHYNTIRSGLNMVYNIFWTLYLYTYNVKLTMFLTERAVLLFTEFVVMSRNPILNKEFRFIPNINDAIAFAIKKTIGPIKISHLNKDKKIAGELSYYKSSSFIIKHIFLHIIHNSINQNYQNKVDNSRQYLEIIINYLSNPILNYYKMNKKDCSLFNTINNILEKFEDNMEKVFYIKFYLELSNLKKQKTKTEKYNLLNSLLSENIDNKQINTENIKNIKKKYFFKKKLNSKKI